MKKRPHPDDAIGEAYAVVEGARRLPEFVKQNRDAIDALILTYSDEDAAWLLEVLREKFWSFP